MNYTYINGGWMIIIPTTVQIIIYIIIIYFVSTISAYIREKHLIKHHLPEIEKSEIQKLRHEIYSLKKHNNQLIEENEKYQSKILGIRQVTGG